MDTLIADYTERRSCIRLVADLDSGWRDLGKCWGFDKTKYLPYSRDNKFRCRIRIGTHATHIDEFPPVEWACSIGANTICIKDQRFEVIVPLDQPWRTTDNPSKNPIVYLEQSMRVGCAYLFQIWVVCHGPGKMYVKNAYEYGDGKSLAGGRPESDRRRF